MSIRTERKSLLDDPALVALGLLPSRDNGGANPAMLSWRVAWILLAVGVAAIIALLWETAQQIVTIWYVSKTFNHGFLILPIVGYLMWMKRGALANRVPQPSWLGAPLLLAAGLGWLLGELGSVGLVQQFALVIMIQGIFAAVFGTEIVKILIFPLFYIFFAVPFGEFLVAPLQDLTAIFVVKGLQILGIPVFLDGIFISIPTGNFEVAEACSGVRFLIATIALGTLFAHLTYHSMTRKVLFVALSLVVPIIANGFRAFGIVLIAYYTNNRLAVGVDHLVYGWIFFAIVTVVLLAIGMTFRDGPPCEEQPDPDIQRSLSDRAPSPRHIGIVMAVALCLGAVGPVYAEVIANRSVAVLEAPLPAPEVGGGWQLVLDARPNWSPEFPGAQAKLFRTYVKHGKQVQVFIAYYTSQRQGAELISFRNTVADGKRWQRAASGSREVRVDNESLKVQRHRLLNRQVGRLAYHWYWIGGRFTSSKTEAKVLQAMGQLLDWREAAAGLIVSTSYDEVPTEGDRTLDDFLSNVESFDALLDRYSRRH